MNRKTKFQLAAFLILLVASFSAAYINHRVTQERMEQESHEFESRQTLNIMSNDSPRHEQNQAESQLLFFEGFSDEDSDNIPDIYNDGLDDYLDDPEDEIRFPPEIYDFSDD